jgi:hypothetical protein
LGSRVLKPTVANSMAGAVVCPLIAASGVVVVCWIELLSRCH